MNIPDKFCPRCNSKTLKLWHEMTHDEKLIAELQPETVRLTSDEKKRHRICTRCRFILFDDVVKA